MISAIMRSPFLDIQHYLHQLMPAILSCTFAKAYENESTDLHWQVRRQAAALVNRVYTDFGEIHQSVKTKLIKTIHEALLNPNKPLSSCCGALILLPMLGEQPFRESVVTNLLIIGNRLTLKLSHNNQRIVGEARYCINQIVKSLEDIVKNHEENIPKELPQPDDEQVIAKASRGVQQILKESAEYSKIWWYLQNPKQIDTFKV
jgi:transcription initiation factor TFIID subunit 6